jgi:Ca2+-binding RTX toxin-like protein
VQLGAGITAAGTQITRDLQNNLILGFGGGDQLKITNYFGQSANRPAIVFADGTNWDYLSMTDQLVFTDTSAGNQYLNGLQGVNNRIVGAAGDTLNAGNLNDTITAGRNNTLNAGAGIDTFVIGKGLGTVVLNESSSKSGGANRDVVQLGAGIAAAGTQVTRDLQNNLILGFGDGDQLKITNYFSQASSRPKLVFADGTSWNYTSVTDRLVFTDTSAGNQSLSGLQGVNNRIVGAAGDTLNAGNLNDTITAGRNNTLNAGAGVDTFIINKGLGQVTLNETSSKSGGANQDVVQLGAGITAAGTQITRDLQNNLILGFGGGDQLKITNYFSQASSRPKLVFADGANWSYATITDQLVFTDTSAGNQYLNGLQGVNNRIVGAAGDTLNAGNLNDTITAGRNNTLNAGAGVDTFIVNKGLGLVTLNETSSKSGGANQDVVQLGAGITAAGTQIARDLQNNLILSFGGGDQLKITNYFSQASSRPKLVFADGTNWSYATIADQLVFTDTGAGNQYLNGLQGVNNRIVGAAGDTLNAGNLNDTITAGRNNTLNAGAGVDTFIVGKGLGQVVLNETSSKSGGVNQDVVQLGAGIAAEATQITRDLQNNLILGFGGGDQLKITGYFSQGANRPKLMFADGTSWNYAAVADRLVFTDTSTGNQYLNGLQGVNNRIVGATGDTINAGNLNDTITVGRNNTLNAGAGIDTFIVNPGTGRVSLTETPSKSGGLNQDVVRFGSGVASDQLWLRRVGNNLEVDVIGTTDALTLNGWYSGSGHVHTLEAGDGKVLNDTRVANLVDAMAAFSPPPAGQTSLPAAIAQQLGPVLAASWQKP